MSKKKEALASQDEFEAELKSEVPVLDVPTIGIVKTDTGYAVVKVLISGKDLTGDNIQVLETADNKFEANEKFKINVIKLGII